MAEIDDIRAAVKVRRDGSVVTRKGGRVVGQLCRNPLESGGYCWLPFKGLGGWARKRAVALDELLRAHLETQ